MLFITPLLFLNNCTKKSSDWITEETVALVNGVPITKKELVNRLELTPFPEFHKPGERNKRALDVLLDELVVSQWAQEQGLENSTDYQGVLDFIKQQALIRELFFEEIRNHAEPDSQQIHQAVQKSIQRLTVQTLFSEDKKIAEEWRKSLLYGKTFEDLVKDSKGNYFVRIDSSSFHWGDGTVPVEVERIAYQLKVGELSDILELPNGFGILFIEHRIQDEFLTPYSLDKKRQQVKQVLQARKESVLANEYADKLLTPMGVKQKAIGFRSVMKFIESEVDFTSGDSLLKVPFFNEEMLLFDKYDLSLTVIETPDFTWDGKDVLDLLRKYNYPINTKSPASLQKSLTRFVKNAVRDHYLADRARQLGLVSSKRVIDDVQMWNRYFLYLKGISSFVYNDSTQFDREVIAEWINGLRKQTQIKINHDLLKDIELTGIPMLVFWNSSNNKQLVVPPLVQFR